MHGEEIVHGLAGMVPGAVLDEDDVLLGLGQYLGQKRLVAGGGEAFSLALPEETPRAVVNQAKDLVGFAFAAGLDEWLLAFV